MFTSIHWQKVALIAKSATAIISLIMIILIMLDKTEHNLNILEATGNTNVLMMGSDRCDGTV